MGETCGMRLPLDPTPLKGICQDCKSYGIKSRKLQKASEDFARMKKDPKLWATAEKRAQEMQELSLEVAELAQKIRTKQMDVSNPRRAAPRAMAGRA